MLTYEEIINYCSNYRIENGAVFDKRTNKQVLDEDTILKVKSSVLLFKEAKESYQSDVKQFGNITKSQEDYIKKTMEKFGVNNEENSFGVNKLVNAILSSNGHYEENMSGKDVFNSKFSILVGAKKDYGLAYLKLKFREKGLDIEDLKVSQDLSELQHNGISKVIIDYKIKKYQKEDKQESNIYLDENQLFQHPKAQELNELEKIKQTAKQNGDQSAVEYYQKEIEKIVRENELFIPPEEWDKLSVEQKISYCKIKMNEAKVFKDEVNYNYWSSNLKMLQDTKEINSDNQRTNIESNNSRGPISQVVDNESAMGHQKDFSYYYNEMIKTIKTYNPNISMSEEQKKQFIGEIFYNEMYMIESISSNADIEKLTTLVVRDLGDSDLERKLSNIIITELQEKYRELNPTKQQAKDENNKKQKQLNNSNELDLSRFISELRRELNEIKNAYNVMIKDGYIDDQELETLTIMIDKVVNDGYTLKSLATSQNDLRTIDSIIDILEEEQRKMKNVQNGIKEIGRSL